MSAALTLEWDRRALSALGGDPMKRALARALSKAGGDTIRAMKATSNREIRARKRIKAGRITRALPLRFPKTRSIEGLEWRMDVSGAAFPLSAYPYRQTKRGVSFSVNQGKRALFKGAFVAKMKSGHIGIFHRLGKKRLPIDELFSSRISDVFNDRGMIPAIQRRGQDVFRASFARLLPLELAKVAP